MKYLKRTLVLAGLFILFACQHDKPYPVAMQQAERCLLQNLDSALTCLTSLDSVIQYEPAETQMYHALLTTKVKDKKYIPHQSDSVMTKVVRFYESYGDKNKLIEAYYYLGSVYRDMRDAPRAIIAFQKAAEIGENGQQYDILGKVYLQMGTLLAYQSLYEEALKIYKKSYAFCLNKKNDLGLVYALRNQGRMYESLHQPDSTKYYYEAAYNKALETKDQKLINAISAELGHVYLNNRELDSAEKLFSQIIGYNDDAIYLSGVGLLHQLSSRPDSAEFYYLRSLEKGKRNQNVYLKSEVNEALSELEARKGNYQSAYNYALNSLQLNDTIKDITRTEAIGKINALYNYRHTEQENKQLLLKNKQTQIYVYLLIIVLLLIAGIAAIYINYTRRQKRLAREQIDRLSRQKEEQYKYSQDCLAKNKEKIREIKMQLQEMPDLKARLTETEEKLLKLQQERLELDNQLIKTREYERLIRKDFFVNSSIYKYFHDAADEGSLTKINEENWLALAHEIDKAFDNFTNRLKALYPLITEHELRLCCLIKANISPRGMAQILCISASAISNGRARLYKKICNKEGNGEMLDKLITDL